MGYNSSYTWQSILEGRSVLEKGLIWIVGDGQQVHAWTEPWINDGGCPYVQQTATNVSQEMCVAELF